LNLFSHAFFGYVHKPALRCAKFCHSVGSIGVSCRVASASAFQAPRVDAVGVVGGDSFVRETKAALLGYGLTDPAEPKDQLASIQRAIRTGFELNA